MFLSAAHLTLLGQVTITTKSDPFQLTFAPLPSVTNSQSSRCDWCQSKLKRLESEKIDLTEALYAAQEDCDQSQAELVHRLSDLQDKYEQLHEAYSALLEEKNQAVVAESPQAANPHSESGDKKDHQQKSFEHCLDKIASHGWTCHDASEDEPVAAASAAPDNEPTQPATEPAPVVTEPADPANSGCKSIEDDLAKKSADFDSLTAEKNKLEEENKDLKDQLAKKAEAPALVATTDDSADKIKVLELKVATLEADLRSCLDGKAKYTSFIAELNDSLANALKEKEALAKEIKDVKSAAAAVQSEKSDEKKARDQIEIQHASVWVGGRSH
jgi:chromosome segregation ATPase